MVHAGVERDGRWVRIYDVPFLKLLWQRILYCEIVYYACSTRSGCKPEEGAGYSYARVEFLFVLVLE